MSNLLKWHNFQITGNIPRRKQSGFQIDFFIFQAFIGLKPKMYVWLFFSSTAALNYCLKCGQKDIGFVEIFESLLQKMFLLKKKKKTSQSLHEAFPFSHTGPVLVISQDNTFHEVVLLPFNKITPPCKPVSASTKPGFSFF